MLQIFHKNKIWKIIKNKHKNNIKDKVKYYTSL